MVFDCIAKVVSGATLAIEPAADPFYALSATGTETGTLGTADFINIPPGLKRVTATLNGQRYGNASVLTRAGGLTFLALAPTP
jgi:hypothetical protein